MKLLCMVKILMRSVLLQLQTLQTLYTVNYFRKMLHLRRFDLVLNSPKLSKVGFLCWYLVPYKADNEFKYLRTYLEVFIPQFWKCKIKSLWPKFVKSILTCLHLQYCLFEGSDLSSDKNVDFSGITHMDYWKMFHQ